MNKGDFLTIMERLEAAYPARFDKMGEDGKVNFYKTWYSLLKDLDKKALWHAASYHIKTSKFFPTIAELRELAKECGE